MVSKGLDWKVGWERTSLKCSFSVIDIFCFWELVFIVGCLGRDLGGLGAGAGGRAEERPSRRQSDFFFSRWFWRRRELFTIFYLFYY